MPLVRVDPPGRVSQDVVERYDEALNEGTDALVDALERVSRENMEADIERFIDALHAGHIEPIDFLTGENHVSPVGPPLRTGQGL